jgi:general stress protein 26
MTHDQKRREAMENLAELIADVPVAMLTTCAPDGSLHSRPMVNINQHFQGELWFLTKSDDPKVQEIHDNPQLNIAFASPDTQRYVSVSGQGRCFQDRTRCELLWTRECERWFPNGLADENLSLIQIEVGHAEYWDAQQNAMVRMAGMLTGGHSSPEVKHEKLRMGRSPDGD